MEGYKMSVLMRPGGDHPSGVLHQAPMSPSPHAESGTLGRAPHCAGIRLLSSYCVYVPRRSGASFVEHSFLYY